MREALQIKFRTFQQQGARFVPLSSSAMPEKCRVSTTARDSGESDEEGFFLHNESEWEEDEDIEVPVEQVRLGLPSSFDEVERAQMGMTRLGEIVLEL